MYNRYLLDTHVFIWVNRDPKKLSKAMIDVLSNPQNTFYLSMASLWEMQIKIRLGKLTVMPKLEEIFATIQRDDIYQILPITAQHLINLNNLPTIHRDPFDHLIISQAITENLILLSKDNFIKQYPIEVIS